MSIDDKLDEITSKLEFMDRKADQNMWAGPNYTTSSSISGSTISATLFESRQYCKKHCKIETVFNRVDNIDITIKSKTYCQKCVLERIESLDELNIVPEHIPSEQIDDYIKELVKKEKSEK